MPHNARLHDVSISHPCPKRWGELVGGDSTRFCSSCELHVHDLSAMGRAEAEAFLERRQGSGERLCLTYIPSPSGGVATREELRSLRRRRALRRFLAPLRSAGAFLVGLLAVLPGCGPKPQAPREPSPEGEEQTAQPEPPPCEELRLLGDVAYAGDDEVDLELLRTLGYASE